MANNLNANKISFLHGTEASLAGLRNNSSKINPGTFYVTSDTHRLYLGIQEGSNKKIVSLNQGVITVQTIDDLPSGNDNLIGQFYYVSTLNILCVWNGKEWVQINPDTDISSVELTTATLDQDYTRLITLTQTITQSNNETFETTWGFSAHNTGVNVLSTQDSNGNPIFEFKNTAEPGAIDAEDCGKLCIRHTVDEATAHTIFASTDSDALKITSDEETNTISFDASNLKAADITGITHEALASGFKTTLERGENKELFATFDPKIKYGKDGSEVVSFNNGEATLDVYSTTDVQNLLKDLNPMTFMGVLSTEAGSKHTELPTSGVHVGDTYKVGQNDKYDNTGAKVVGNLVSGRSWAKIGDLFIATSSNDPLEVNGEIPSGKIVWEYVPAGDEEGVVYAFVEQNHGFKVNSGSSTLFNFALQEGSNITFLDDAASTDGVKTVQVNHATIDTTPTTAATTLQDDAKCSHPSGETVCSYKTIGDPVNFLTSITVDSGHVTGYTTSPIKFVDTNASVKQVGLTATSTTGGVSLNSAVTLFHPGAGTADNSDSKSANLKFISDNSNLQLSVKNTGDIALNLVWGSFDPTT